MKAYERFLQYIAVPSASDETSETDAGEPDAAPEAGAGPHAAAVRAPVNVVADEVERRVRVARAEQRDHRLERAEHAVDVAEDEAHVRLSSAGRPAG